MQLQIIMMMQSSLMSDIDVALAKVNVVLSVIEVIIFLIDIIKTSWSGPQDDIFHV